MKTKIILLCFLFSTVASFSQILQSVYFKNTMVVKNFSGELKFYEIRKVKILPGDDVEITNPYNGELLASFPEPPAELEPEKAADLVLGRISKSEEIETVRRENIFPSFIPSNFQVIYHDVKGILSFSWDGAKFVENFKSTKYSEAKFDILPSVRVFLILGVFFAVLYIAIRLRPKHHAPVTDRSTASPIEATG